MTVAKGATVSVVLGHTKIKQQRTSLISDYCNVTREAVEKAATVSVIMGHVKIKQIRASFFLCTVILLVSYC